MADPRPPIQLPPISQRNFSQSASQNGVVRDVSAYATDLTHWDNAHKHKFLFVTEIVLHPYYQAIAKLEKFALLAQTASRPKMKFDHMEYNSYGIRKGVHTKTIFEPMNISFVDDNNNSVMQFFTNVNRLMSPITNIDNSSVAEFNQYNFKPNSGAINSINTTGAGVQIQEVVTGQNRPNVYAQSAGYPGGSNKISAPDSPASIFSSVKIHHVHLFGEGVNTFVFKNPRLLTMDFDDLDMAASNDVALLKMSFGYDYLTTSTGKMTAEISRLVGTANYYIRRDLSDQPYTQPQSVTVAAAQNKTDAIKLVANKDAQVLAATQAKAITPSPTEQAAFENLIQGLQKTPF
jgi:hypothetical protein